MGRGLRRTGGMPALNLGRECREPRGASLVVHRSADSLWDVSDTRTCGSAGGNHCRDTPGRHRRGAGDCGGACERCRDSPSISAGGVFSRAEIHPRKPSFMVYNVPKALSPSVSVSLAYCYPHRLRIYNSVDALAMASLVLGPVFGVNYHHPD